MLVTLDGLCITGYCGIHAVADAPHESAAHADPASRRGVAQAPAHGGGPAPGVGLDPAGDPGDDGTLPVARSSGTNVPRGSDPRSRPPARGDRRRVRARALPPDARGGVTRSAAT